MKRFGRLEARSRLNQKGLTLVEVAVTMMVVVLMLSGYLATNVVIQRAQQGAFERAVALQDAHQVIEDMRNKATQGQFPGNITGTYPDGGTVSGFSDLTSQQVTVSYADPTANPLDVTVSVSWLENGVRQVQTDLRTLVTPRAQ